MSNSTMTILVLAIPVGYAVAVVAYAFVRGVKHVASISKKLERNKGNE